MYTTGRVYLAELKVVPPGAQVDSGRADATLQMGNAAGARRAQDLLRKALGPSLAGAQQCTLLARPPADITPIHLALETDAPPTAQQLQSFLSATNLVASASGPGSQLLVQPVGSNVFLLSVDLSRCYTAADYLTWSKRLDPDFNIIREALKRPYARMEGNYQQPMSVPIQNFVGLRSAVQILAQRAQCHLLLGRPEAALSELTLLHEMCRLLEAAPTHKPMTLVAAMIDVAVTGLYTDVVADGFRMRAWREPELRALQEQCEHINLVPYLAHSFACERADNCRTLETLKPAALNYLITFGRQSAGFWDYLRNPKSLLVPLIPRGWIYQNLCTLASVKETLIEAVNSTNLVLNPQRVEESNREALMIGRRRSPYCFLAAIAVPNMIRSAQTLAYRQSLVQQTIIACALERFRLAHGHYPENLDALVPDFVAKVPLDVINGATFKYRRTADQEFLLYSVGWNEQDDGGVAGKTLAEGDWVWRVE